jgi:transposase
MDIHIKRQYVKRGVMKKQSKSVMEGKAVTAQLERTVYTIEFKRAAVARMREGTSTATALALELGIRRNQLYKWANMLDELAPGEVRKRGRVPADEEAEIVRLRRKVAKMEEELAILKKFDAYLTQLKK